MKRVYFKLGKHKRLWLRKDVADILEIIGGIILAMIFVVEVWFMMCMLYAL